MMMASPPPSEEGGRLGSRNAQPQQQADGSKQQLPRFYQAALQTPREDVVVS